MPTRATPRAATATSRIRARVIRRRAIPSTATRVRAPLVRATIRDTPSQAFRADSSSRAIRRVSPATAIPTRATAVRAMTARATAARITARPADSSSAASARTTTPPIPRRRPVGAACERSAVPRATPTPATRGRPAAIGAWRVAPATTSFPPIPVGTQTKRRRGRGPIVLAIVIVLLAVVGGGGYWGIGKVRSYFGAPDYSGAGTSEIVKVKVANGDSSTAIAQTLVTDGVIKSTKAFINAAKADPKSVDDRGRLVSVAQADEREERARCPRGEGCRRQPGQSLRLQGDDSRRHDLGRHLYAAVEADRHSGQRVHHGGQGPGRPRGGQIVVYGQARRPSSRPSPRPRRASSTRR